MTGECDGPFAGFTSSSRRANAARIQAGLRVIRVGTHAVSSGSRTTLWNRLSQHRGVARTGGGNHRGSVFRLLVGAALMAREPGCAAATWGGGRPEAEALRAAEHRLERSVSRAIGEMHLLWLRVDDPAGRTSLRSYVERNAIALFSNYDSEALDPPSAAWLGLDCPKDAVRRSGLWNQRHVNTAHDRAFLPTLERLVEEHLPWEDGA